MSFQSNKKIFNIDSANRVSGTDSNFSHNVIAYNNKFTHVTPISIEIPKAWDMLDSTNNTLTMTQTDASTALITITAGNYTAAQLASTLQTKLIAAGTLTDAATYLVTYNAQTNKFTISNAATNFTVTFASSSILNKYLGIVSGSVSSANALTSTNDSNLQRYSCIAIRSSICKNYDNDILGYLYPSSYADGSIIKFEPGNPTFTACTFNGGSNIYDFTLVDADTNSVVSLDGVNWRMMIVCWRE